MVLSTHTQLTRVLLTILVLVLYTEVTFISAYVPNYNNRLHPGLGWHRNHAFPTADSTKRLVSYTTKPVYVREIERGRGRSVQFRLFAEVKSSNEQEQLIFLPNCVLAPKLLVQFTQQWAKNQCSSAITLSFKVII